MHEKSNVLSLQLLCIQCITDYNVPYEEFKPSSKPSKKKSTSWNPLKSFTKKSNKKDHLLSENEYEGLSKEIIHDIQIETKQLNQNTRLKIIRRLEEYFTEYTEHIASFQMQQFNSNSNGIDQDPLLQGKPSPTDRIPRHDAELYDNEISMILQERLATSNQYWKKEQ